MYLSSELVLEQLATRYVVQVRDRGLLEPEGSSA
jgi:hypothetical protein